MSTFVIYRYQFAPIKDREPSLSGNMNVDLSDEELMDKKQDIFCDILKIESKQSLEAVLRTLIYTFAPIFKFGTK